MKEVQKTFVYAEVTPPEGMKKSGQWAKVIAIPVSQSMADVLVKLFEVEYPGKSFVASEGFPRSYIA